ncbi:MAG: hypothetical protein R2854_25965 [Caldilineaceae bacterium]
MQGAIVGLVTAIPPIVLTVFIANVNTCTMFVNALPELVTPRTLVGVACGQRHAGRSVAAPGVVGALRISPNSTATRSWRVLPGFMGLLAELIIIQILRNLFGNNGAHRLCPGALKPLWAGIVFFVAAFAPLRSSRRGARAIPARHAALDTKQQRMWRRSSARLCSSLSSSSCSSLCRHPPERGARPVGVLCAHGAEGTSPSVSPVCWTWAMTNFAVGGARHGRVDLHRSAGAG